MKYLKLLGAFTVFASIATGSMAAELPSALRQLDAQVNALHPFSPADGRGGGTAAAEAYTYARDHAAAAYLAGDIQEGCRLEAFARHVVGVVGQPVTASCSSAMASADY